MSTPTTAPASPPVTPAGRSDSTVWLAAVRAAGWFLLALGAVTLFAWGCGEQDYLQLAPSMPPLHYNGGIAFAVWGAAYLALARGRGRTALALAAVLGAIGLLVAAASVPGVGFRLDRWLFAAPAARGGYPAGVTAGVGVLYLVAAGALAALARRGANSAAALSGFVGGVCTVVAPVALLTAQTGDVFGRGAGPSLLGAAGIFAAGVPLLGGLRRRGAPTLVPGHVVPLAVSVVGIVGTGLLWAALNGDQNRRVHRQVQFETAYVQRLALDRLPQEVNRVGELAEEWSRSTPEEVKSYVGSYVGQMPSCLGVARIDSNRQISWIEAHPGQPQTLAALGGADALAAAVEKGEPAAVRPPRSNWNGVRVLLVFAPHTPGTPDGGLVAVLRVQELFDTFMNANVSAGYAITVSEGGETVFNRYSSDQVHRERWGQALPLAFRGHDWRVSVWPTEDALARESLSLPKFALLIGLLMTALLALAVHLAQTARWRAWALEKEVLRREHAQLALAQSEGKYRTLIENLGQGIFLQDRDRRYVAANARFCHSVGRTEAEVVGATAADLFPPDQAAGLAAEVERVLTDGQSVESEHETTADGRRACARRVLTPVRDAAGRVTGVLGISWDVTEQRRLEAHVNQASKMDAIGQLAGGIAHDFNNLLTVILGNLDLMLGRGADDHDRELVASAREAAVRAASLTQRLLGFSRRHQLDWRATDLNALTTDVVALLRRTIDPLTRIETHLSPDLWPVQADPTQLNQVLMNLCLNARDAIGGAGAITIETDRVACPDRRDGGDGARGEFVRLRVTDTGGGMAPDVKARIYEPFFTTKDVGKGTGLGLPMVFAIVRQHKGWIDCWSEVGRGTRFDIYLPRGAAAKTAAPAQEKPEPRRGGQGTVLVVDDEEMIRRLAATALERSGYRVLQAADGQQAVDAYAADGDRIDLVLLDLTMPVLSGHETFRQLLALNPRVKVVFASGYAEEHLSDLEKQQMAGFVKKPYRPNDLVLAVEAALEARGRAKVDTPTPLSLSHYRMPSMK